MSSPPCPTCGTPHGAAQRYCLACGALVGRRPLDPGEAIALRSPGAAAPDAASAAAASPVLAAAPTAGSDAPPAVVVPAPVADVGLWRRPATSILTAVALATGVTVGFVLESQSGSAVGAPLAQSGPAVTTPATTTPGGAASPTADSKADVAPAVATTDPGTADSPAAPDAADAATPAGTAPATTPVSSVAGPGAGDVATPTATPAADDAAQATTPDDDDASETATSSPGRGTSAPSAAKPSKSTKPAKPTAAAAAGLPKIDHIWVVGIGAPVSGRESGYLAEDLLPAGTELTKYAPVATDPLAGAADLVAGRGPSATATTIANQLTAAKRPWRSYAAGTPSCTDAPGVNPFLAFPSVASKPSCADGIAGLSALPADLAQADATPAFSYVATDPALDAAGLDAQLRQVVEPIRRSAAYKRSGLIAIVPTAANPAARTGALLLSPFAASSTSVGTAFGPYSLLRTFEDLLGLDRLGHAADAGVRALGPDVLTPED